MLGGEKGGEAKAEPQRPPGFQSGAEAVPEVQGGACGRGAGEWALSQRRGFTGHGGWAWREGRPGQSRGVEGDQAVEVDVPRHQKESGPSSPWSSRPVRPSSLYSPNSGLRC